MTIYSKPVRELIPEMIAELAPGPGRIFSRDAAIDWFRRKYPKIKQGTISAHLIRFATNAPSRRHTHAQTHEDLLYQVDGSRYRLYEPGKDPEPIPGMNAIARREPAEAASATQPMLEEPAEPAGPNEFAYESDLRDFLAKNLSLIEPGLQLYQEEGITGVEFPVGGRFVDILAVDADQRLVVIELKVSRGYDRAVGQILRYMAWIKEHQAEEGQPVRGVIVAREISEDLKLACSSLADVSLFEYELSVTLRRVEA